MDLQLHDKVVLITGGTRNASTAPLLTSAVGRPYGCWRRHRRRRARGAVAEVRERWGRLDGLLNAAGVPHELSLADADDAIWRDDFELKLMATIRGIRIALPLLRESRDSAVTVLSVWAKYQEAGTMPSSVFRSAALALTNGVSKEVAADGVRGERPPRG